MLEHVYQNGKLVQTSYGNGLVRSYVYDSESGQLIESSTDGPGGEVERTTITREGGLPFTPGLYITSETRTFGSVAVTTEEQYGVGPGEDALGQEYRIGKRAYLWHDGHDVAAYEYDALSNALGSPAYQESFEYNAEGNRLLSATTLAAGTIDYSYDEDEDMDTEDEDHEQENDDDDDELEEVMDQLDGQMAMMGNDEGDDEEDEEDEDDEHRD